MWLTGGSFAKIIGSTERLPRPADPNRPSCWSSIRWLMNLCHISTFLSVGQRRSLLVLSGISPASPASMAMSHIDSRPQPLALSVFANDTIRPRIMRMLRLGGNFIPRLEPRKHGVTGQNIQKRSWLGSSATVHFIGTNFYRLRLHGRALAGALTLKDRNDACARSRNAASATWLKLREGRVLSFVISAVKTMAVSFSITATNEGISAGGSVIGATRFLA